jgi:hypothetical protein
MTMEQNETLKLRQKNQNLIRIIIFLIILLVISGTVLTYFYMQQKEETEKVSDEKNQLIAEFETLSRQYDALRTENDTMNLKLAEKQIQIQKLIAQISSLKKTNAEIILQYKKELNTLREIMKSYIVQIDSLNTRNQVLTAENIKVKKQIDEVKAELEQEKTIKEDLSAKVETGSKLSAKNIIVECYTSKQKLTTKATKTENIKVCFVLRENAIAKAGERIIYLVVKKPGGEAFIDSENDVISVENNTQIKFSASRKINYENIDIDVCIFWANKGRLTPGKYEIELYTDGYSLGNSSFEVK